MSKEEQWRENDKIPKEGEEGGVAEPKEGEPEPEGDEPEPKGDEPEPIEDQKKEDATGESEL